MLYLIGDSNSTEQNECRRGISRTVNNKDKSSCLPVCSILTGGFTNKGKPVRVLSVSSIDLSVARQAEISVAKK